MCKSWPPFVSYVILTISEFSEFWQCYYLLLYSSGTAGLLFNLCRCYLGWQVGVGLVPPLPPPTPSAAAVGRLAGCSPGVGQGPSCPCGASGLLLSGCGVETLPMLWWVGWIVLDKDREICLLGCYWASPFTVLWLERIFLICLFVYPCWFQEAGCSGAHSWICAR